MTFQLHPPTDWKFRGGLHAGAGAVLKPKRAVLQSPARAKEARDTVAGCRERAAADLVAADMMDTENGRLRLGRSAASWAERARLLEERDLGAAALKATMRAEWDAEERES